ncbi:MULTISPECIES: FBP domain-containing protein [unclassified Pseudoclavibacter]|uniref:FBP domain-containing protein n=1 Tax=unclassified Pseudoclavibacter TaxID=2615177 RepID=UPI001300E9B4|nr:MULTISPECIES: FBP domain-containing protein [unclassified Pseudoclavibacter]KAB1647434.1 FBP domain-containing protein [Pseudoclavibacter sp. CFCC 14310]KAB1663119.1 FBP domain-containing protein [Pseudoclavibacter sp. CFCC 13611]
MQTLTESFIRSSFVNASRRETKELTFRDDFAALTEEDWQQLDYLGWRDPKYARRAYVVLPRLDGDPVGVLLTRAAAAPRTPTMCHWCRDVRLPNPVVLWSAKRAGAAGRRGDTVGTLICDDFQCSHNVRNDPPAFYKGYDVLAARQQRIDDLRTRVAGFAESLLGAA